MEEGEEEMRLKEEAGGRRGGGKCGRPSRRARRGWWRTVDPWHTSPTLESAPTPMDIPGGHPLCSGRRELQCECTSAHLPVGRAAPSTPTVQWLCEWCDYHLAGLAGAATGGPVGCDHIVGPMGSS